MRVLVCGANEAWSGVLKQHIGNRIKEGLVIDTILTMADSAQKLATTSIERKLDIVVVVALLKEEADLAADIVAQLRKDYERVAVICLASPRCWEKLQAAGPHVIMHALPDILAECLVLYGLGQQNPV